MYRRLNSSILIRSWRIESWSRIRTLDCLLATIKLWVTLYFTCSMCYMCQEYDYVMFAQIIWLWYETWNQSANCWNMNYMMRYVNCNNMFDMQIIPYEKWWTILFVSMNKCSSHDMRKCNAWYTEKSNM